MSDNKKSDKPRPPKQDKKPEDKDKKAEAPKQDKEAKEKTHAPKQDKGEKNHEEKKTGDQKGEHKGEHRGEHRRRGPKQYKERTPITLDTVIPELPKKEDRIPEPNDDALDAELEKISKQIDEKYKKMSDVAREANNKEYVPADKGRADLIALLKVKNSEKSKAYSEFQEANTEKEQYKGQMEEYYQKSNELRFKMRRNGKKEDLEAELRQYKLKQSSGTISLQEEKAIIKEIAEIERSLPYAEPLQELEERFKDVKDNLKKLKKEASAKYEVLSRLKEEVRDIQDQLDKIDEEKEKKKNESTPAIQQMKDKYRAEIDELKNKKKELIRKNRDDWDRYHEQQEEIDRIKWMQKIKARIIKDEERKKKQEEWEKNKKEQEELNKETPYVGEIELCDQLINYCTRILPKVEEAQVNTGKTKEEAVKDALSSDAWKKDKVTQLKGKRELENEFYVAPNKKDKKAAKPVEKKEEENTNAPLNHQIETLNFFESIKVTPPLFVSKLPDTIKILNEKKSYFQKLQDEALKAEENKTEATTETKTEAKGEKQDGKKKKQGTKNLDLENESEFPKFS